MAVPFCIPNNKEWEFLLLHIFTSIWCCQCSNVGHSGSGISFLFKFAFPSWHMMWNIFSYIYLPSEYLLWWGVCQDLWPIFNPVVCFLLLSFESYLCILDNSPLLMHLLQIFSPSLRLVFSFSWHCLSRVKLLILMKSSLSIPSFMDCAFGVVSKKASPHPQSSRLSPIF